VGWFGVVARRVARCEEGVKEYPRVEGRVVRVTTVAMIVMGEGLMVVVGY